MIIKGEPVERPDGTERVVGYGVDTDGRVTGRFALPDGAEWDAPEDTESIKTLDSWDALSDHPVHEAHSKE